MSLPTFATVGQLYIYEGEYMSLHWQNDIENYQWLEFIHRGEEPLPVQGVFTTYRANPQELVGGGATELLPTLQSLP
jgi:hypothetical protein